MTQTDKPKALLLISSHCPHCHTLETLLRERMTNGLLGSLDVINIEQSPKVAQQYGVRSVPWLQLGDFVFDEVLAPMELDGWIEQVREGAGQSHYITHLLERGKLARAIEWLEKGKATLKAIIPVLADPEAKMNVRLGVGAILEHFEDSQTLRAIVPDLLELLTDSNPAIRVDACHYLSLTHSRDAIEALQKMLDDEDQQVRQVAGESIEALVDKSAPG